MHDRDEEFREVALPHLDALFALAMRLTRNRTDAEDLVQETYLRAYRFFETYRPGTHARAWLFRILRNTAINRYRALGARPREVDVSGPEGAYESIVDEYALGDRRTPTPEQIVMDGVVDGEIEAAIAELPESHREVVLLALVADLSYREIAATLSIPIGTVMSRLHRGRRRLQARLVDLARRRGIFGPARAVADDDRPEE